MPDAKGVVEAARHKSPSHPIEGEGFSVRRKLERADSTHVPRQDPVLLSASPVPEPDGTIQPRQNDPCAIGEVQGAGDFVAMAPKRTLALGGLVLPILLPSCRWPLR